MQFGGHVQESRLESVVRVVRVAHQDRELSLVQVLQEGPHRDPGGRLLEVLVRREVPRDQPALSLPFGRRAQICRL
jgi:hypothetical protein